MDKKIAVVTGGGRGMGFAAAKKLAEKYYVIITDVNEENLNNAVKELKDAGFDAEGKICDVSDRAKVEEVAKYAAGLGDIQAVVNIAGLSPSMTTGDVIWKVNAIGTQNMTECFTPYLKEKACICCFSSMSGDMFPDFQVIRSLHNLYNVNKDAYNNAMMKFFGALPGALSGALGYMFSKNFVNYWCKLYSRKLMGTNIRIVTISPGDFATPMGMLEKDGAATYIPNASINRFGDPEEMAFLVDCVVDERNSYLTGAEILNDGGVIASLQTSFPYYIKATIDAGMNQFHIREKIPFLKK